MSLKKLPFNSTFLKVHFLFIINQSRPFSVTQIISEFSEIPAEDDNNEDKESEKPVAHPWRSEVDEAIKTLRRLSLFTEDLSFDSLISKPTLIINQ